MSLAHHIKESVDSKTGRRLVSVTYDELGSTRILVIPFELLADDLLEFLAMAAPLYPDEVRHLGGFQKFQAMVLKSQEQQ